MSTLTFHPRAQSDLFAKVTGADLPKGHAIVTINVALRNELTGEPAVTKPLVLHLMGPADVAGLQASAVVHSAPKTLARECEVTKLTHVDFAEIDLPWRYSFETPKPWMVLLTGTTDELELQNGQVRIKNPSVLVAHNLLQSALWAHVMEENGRKVARIISPRGLEDGGAGLLPNREYVAVLVPAYQVRAGKVEEAWTVAGAGLSKSPEGNLLTAYVGWRFWTADAGDFETIAARLHAVEVGGLGTSDLKFDRLATPEALKVRGAITSLAATQDTISKPVLTKPTTWPPDTEPASDDVLDAVTAMRTAVTHPRCPVLGIPNYGVPYIAEPVETDWGRLLNEDPRFRGIAGLGAWLVMEAQEELVDAARAQVGALGEAQQRVRQLALGLMSARSLWNRRLPADPEQQLYLFGPTMRRLPGKGAGPEGVSVLDMVTGGARSLPRAALSAAARRFFRDGEGIARNAKPGAVNRGPLLEATNRCPELPSSSKGHIDAVLDDLRVRPLMDLLGLQPIPQKVREVIRKIVERNKPIDADEVARRLFDVLEATLGVPPTVEASLLTRLSPYEKTFVTVNLLEDIVRPFVNLEIGHGHEDETGTGAIIGSLGSPLERPCEKVDLTKLGQAVGDAISPLGDNAPALVRVLATLEPPAIRKLELPEVCFGLNYEVWKLLRDKAKSWLLPGIEAMEKDAVVAMESNPAFIDALLVGMNTQFVQELRWRNIGIAPKCTPLRWFWGNFDYKEGQRTDDIFGIHKWVDSRLGANEHQPLRTGDVSGNRDLVMVFRTDLFRRYPSTLVYLVPVADEDKLKDPQPNFTPGHAKGPKIKGSIGDDITFFIFDVNPSELADYFVVLDEPPAELRFRNDKGTDSTNSAKFASHMIDRPTRVAIDGAHLAWKGLPDP